MPNKADCILFSWVFSVASTSIALFIVGYVVEGMNVNNFTTFHTWIGFGSLFLVGMLSWMAVIRESPETAGLACFNLMCSIGLNSLELVMVLNYFNNMAKYHKFLKNIEIYVCFVCIHLFLFLIVYIFMVGYCVYSGIVGEEEENTEPAAGESNV